MWCGLCVKRNAKNCYRKGKSSNTKSSSPACAYFVINTRKIPASILKKAIELGTLPKSHIKLLIALLDQGIKLSTQNLRTGMTIKYPMDVSNTGHLTNHRVHIISSPKNSNEAYGVVFLKKPKNSTVSITLDKELFIRERDKKLKDFWAKINTAFLSITDEKARREKLTRIFKIMGKSFVDKMLRLNGINIRVKSRKLEDTVTIVLRTYL